MEISIPCSQDKLIYFKNDFIYIHSFRFITPRQVSDSLKYNFINSSKDLKTVADKLRYYRHLKGLKQSDIADYIGIDRGTYSYYEAASREYYKPEIMDKIAKLLAVDITSLQYINEKRLLRAKEMLNYSNYPIETIANHCGFNSSIYFTRLFKEKYGIPPDKYRNN